MKLLESKMYQDDLSKAIKNIDLKLLDNKTFFITGGLGLIGSTPMEKLVKYILEQEIIINSKRDLVDSIMLDIFHIMLLKNYN